MDIFILVWSILHWEEIALKPIILAVIGVLINFVWQVFNVVGHFTFLKMEDPREPSMSMLKKSRDSKKDFSLIKTDSELLKLEFPYVVDSNLGTLENKEINNILLDKNLSFIPVLSHNKRKDIRTYIKQYKETLLKFLNHRWYEICRRGGMFTNDKKVCFASEPYKDVDGVYKWRVTKGRYYYGYLTNFIYTRYVGGSHYKLYAPINMNTDSIKSLGSSDFSDHIGVSTLLYTSDGYVFVFRQADNAAYNANCYMPTGSGSMDYKDYREGEDLRQIITRAAERELSEESTLKKLLGKKVFAQVVHTSVIGYYRDMERGGKPEFCCISRIDKAKEDVIEYIRPSKQEAARKSGESFLLSDKEKWEKSILPDASLSLIMNYKYLEELVKGE